MAKSQCIGVVSDSPLQRHVIQGVLNDHGLDVALICDPMRLDDQPEEKIEQVQCWILDLPDDDNEYKTIDKIFEEDETPVLYGLEPAPDKSDETYLSWERRLVSKLEAFLDDLAIDDDQEIEANSDQYEIQSRDSKKQVRVDRTIAQDVWILAASTGGPEAVKEFLDHIPVTIKAGFLYAQHIDNHFSDVLTKVLGRHGEIPIKAMEQGDQIIEGEALVVPVGNEVVFSEEGCDFKESAWPGPYGPSINQLLSNVLAHYDNRCHTIIFSGMGDDGCESAKKIKAAGGKVWTQSLDSCANDSMPRSVSEAGLSDYSADPKKLAEYFTRFVGVNRSCELAPTNQNEDKE